MICQFQEEKAGIKRRETDLGSNQFLKCSPQPGTHKEIHRVGQREQGEGGDRGDLVEKKESQKGERAIKPVSRSQVKMGTEDWVLKGTKLITNTKKQRLKIYSRGQTLKYTILKKQNKVTKIIQYLYEACFKNRVFFLQGNTRL